MSDTDGVDYIVKALPFIAVAGIIAILNIIFCCYLMRLRSEGIREINIGYKIAKFDSKKTTNDICAVCLEDFKPKETIGLCTCHHGFHVTCISQWLESKRTCPICKVEVKPRPTERTYLVPAATASV